jgi:TPR repeat protein
MGWLIGIVVACWIGFQLLKVLFALLQGLSRVGNEMVEEAGKLAGITKAKVASTRFFNTPEVGAWALTGGVVLLLVSLAWGATAVLSTLDNIGGWLTPYIGWVIVGVPAGALLSFRSRVYALSGFRMSVAIDRVPSIEALHAGEQAAEKIHTRRRWIAAGAVAAVAVVVTISSVAYLYSSLDSQFSSGVYAHKSFISNFLSLELEETVRNDQLQKAARALQNDAVDARVETLNSALTWLKQLSETGKAGGSPSVAAGFGDGSRAKTARHLLEQFHQDTATAVREKTSHAFARATAYRSIDPAESEFWLGSLCENGACTQPHGISGAFDHYRAAVTLGSEKANGGLRRTAERLATSDDAKVRAVAFEYFRQEADKGKGAGYLWVARQLRNGDGVPIDKGAAQTFFVKALQAEDVASAVAAFDELQSGGTPFGEVKTALDEAAPNFARLDNPVARAKGYEYLEQRGAEGDPAAELWTGYRYKDGIGVQRDSAKARGWFMKAAQQTSNVTVRKQALAALRVMNQQAN